MSPSPARNARASRTQRSAPAIIWFTPSDRVESVAAQSGQVICFEMSVDDVEGGLAWVRSVRALHSNIEGGLDVLVVSPSANLDWKRRENIRRDVVSEGASFFETKSAAGLRAEVERSFGDLYASFHPPSTPLAPSPGDNSVIRTQYATTARSLTDSEIAAASGGMHVQRGSSAVTSFAKSVGAALGLIARELK